MEVIEATLAANVDLKRPLVAAFFSNEEGSRYPPDMMGSLAYVGGMSVESVLEVEGADGTIVGEELERIGYCGAAPCPGAVPHAFVELHIEQGPVLDNEAVQIGVVEGVQGISWTELKFIGQSNHAGTTPMSLRRDPAAVAAEAAAAASNSDRSRWHPSCNSGITYPSPKPRECRSGSCNYDCRFAQHR